MEHEKVLQNERGEFLTVQFTKEEFEKMLLDNDDLTDFMKHLYEAGFDVQVILSKGFDFAVRSMPGMDIGSAYSQAAERVRDVAQDLHIDREAQFKAYANARDDMRYRMRAQP